MTVQKALNKYELHQCALYKCRSRKRLAKVLMRDYAEIKSLWLAAEDYYSSYGVGKKDGDKRVINYSKSTLKSVQKRILKLLRNVRRPEWLMSGERGKSYVTNGRAHLNSDYLLTMDVKKFYDNCQREYVYRFFVDTMHISRDVAWMLANIVTFKGGIPTGCPTSQMLAYYAYQEMFAHINHIAQQHNCVFTLYVDDMTFSSIVPFDPKRLTQSVQMELRKFGHRLKYEKVKYYRKGVHKLVTGVVISKDHTLQVPNRLRNKIYEQAMDVKKLMATPGKLQDVESLKILRSLKGRVQSAQNVEQVIFPEVKRLVERAIDMA